jgi:glutaredoxin
MKNILKKLSFFLTIAVFSLQIIVNCFNFEANAREQVTTIHIFSSKLCPHCREAEKFLKELKEERPELIIYQYEVSYQQNSQLLTFVANNLAVSGQGVPFIVINNQAIIGFSSATPSKIHQLLSLDKVESDLIAEIVRTKKLTPIINEFERDETETDVTETTLTTDEQNEEIELPLFGKVQLKEISLPLLTIMIGFIDGFNPCAMWVLIFLISLLMGMNDRRRMWILGSVFIFTSGFVYFLFMTAWLNFFIFLGLVNWIRIAIAVLAIFVAVHYLRDFVKNKDGSCQVDLGGKKQKVFASLKNVVYRENLLWSLFGIILLAFSVNLLELVCSAGLPAVYTKILSMSELSTAQYYLYLLIYIVVFMLDDMAVFTITMITMKRVALNTKYARYSHLIGGIVMLIIGLLMFFKPEWIMFG